MESQLKRISLMVREDQYESITSEGLNLSGLIRDLLDDYFSEHKITLSVEEDTKKIYDQLVANTGTTDKDLEKYLREALGKLLGDRIKSMQALEKKLKGSS